VYVTLRPLFAFGGSINYLHLCKVRPYSHAVTLQSFKPDLNSSPQGTGCIIISDRSAELKVVIDLCNEDHFYYTIEIYQSRFLYTKAGTKNYIYLYS